MLLFRTQPRRGSTRRLLPIIPSPSTIRVRPLGPSLFNFNTEILGQLHVHRDFFLQAYTGIFPFHYLAFRAQSHRTGPGCYPVFVV